MCSSAISPRTLPTAGSRAASLIRSISPTTLQIMKISRWPWMRSTCPTKLSVARRLPALEEAKREIREQVKYDQQCERAYRKRIDALCKKISATTCGIIYLSEEQAQLKREPGI